MGQQLIINKNQLQMKKQMLKAYQKPEVRVVSLEQERYLMIGFTFENYAKQNGFVESETDENTNYGNMWKEEDEL